MHAIVAPILKLAHKYHHDGREMKFYTTHLHHTHTLALRYIEQTITPGRLSAAADVWHIRDEEIPFGFTEMPRHIRVVHIARLLGKLVICENRV